MKMFNKTISLFICIILILTANVYAHGGNISGWQDKDSNKITKHNGVYFGYHNENGERHYHVVEWNNEQNRWDIIAPAIYYDSNFNEIDKFKDVTTEKLEVKYVAKVDGDTAKFELKGNTITVRFLGINTPETVDKQRGEEPYGKEASQFTQEKLENAKKIEIEYDNNSDKQDKYGRTLAWIWVDDVLLEEELVKNGLAETYMLQNNYRYAGSLQLAEKSAKDKNLGIWGGETLESTNVESTPIQTTDAAENTVENSLNENTTNTTENTVTGIAKEVLNSIDWQLIVSAIISVFLAGLGISGYRIKTSKKRKKRG